MSKPSFILTIFIVTCLIISATAQTLAENPLLRETDPAVLRDLRALSQKVRDTGCDINLCFALQGDDFIDDAQFEDQKNFVDLMVAILSTDKTGNFCAVQYGRTTRRICPLTGRKLQFLRKLRRAQRVGGFETNIAAALGYTGFQLRPRKEDANKIIILGDGLESLGFGPTRVADIVRQDGTEICAVAIGGFSTASLIEIVGGDSNKIVTIDGFFDLGEIVVGLVNDVCGFIV